VPTAPGSEERKAAAPDRGLARRHRLCRGQDIRDAFSQRRQVVGRLMVMWVRHAPDACLRVGVVASRRTFRRAVDRNRAKRLLREAFRLHRHELRGRVDVVLVGRGYLRSATCRDAEADLLSLARRAGLLGRGPRGTDKAQAQGDT
jgi:ribonuclease P protein component